MGVEWKNMTVWGGTVSAEWQREAWDKMHGVDGLEVALIHTGPRDGRDAPVPDVDHHPSAWYFAEIANRMTQRARKAGVIEYAGTPKKWRFIAGGQ